MALAGIWNQIEFWQRPDKVNLAVRKIISEMFNIYFRWDKVYINMFSTYYLEYVVMDDDRIGILYSLLKNALKDQFVFEKMLSECDDSELQALEDLCSRCAEYKQQFGFLTEPSDPSGLKRKISGWNLLGRSRK